MPGHSAAAFGKGGRTRVALAWTFRAEMTAIAVMIGAVADQPAGLQARARG